MSVFIYNGIELKDISIQRYHREPIYHGPTYLYTRNIVHVRGIYNPAATSWNLPGNFGPPELFAGKNAPTTDLAIRNHLLTPRKLLRWSTSNRAGDTITLLFSPPVVNLLQATTDANNGPTPLSCDVVKNAGDKTFWVDFVIQTDLNEYSLFAQKPNIILSHLWRMTDDIDQDFFTTRTIQGQLILRTDRRLELNAVPDEFRGWIFHPVPTNFQRESINVTALEDGSRLDYKIVDREKASNIVAQGVTRITAIYSQGLKKPSHEDAIRAIGGAVVASAANITELGGRAVGAIGGGFTGSAPLKILEQFGNLGGAIAAEQMRSGWRIGQAVGDQVPRFYHTLKVEVWGNRNANRTNLQSVARQVLNKKVGQLNLAFGGLDYSVTHDLMGKYVRLDAQLLSGPTQGAIDQLFRAFNAGAARPFAVPDFSFGPDDAIPDITSIVPVVNPAPPNDSGSRGTFIGRLAANVLRDHQTNPTQPAAAPDSASRTPIGI